MIDTQGNIDREWFDGLTKSEKNALSFKKHHPEEYNIIHNSFGDSFSEKIYCYFNRIASNPICPICGNLLKYRAGKGYQKYCSLACVGKSDEVKQSREKTSLERYGEMHYTNRDKAEKTCMERYGVTNVSASPEVQKKRNETCLERYGSTCSLNDPYIRAKAIKTTNERYGVDYSIGINSKKYHDKSTKNRLRNIVLKNDNILRYTDDWKMWVMRCPHHECNKCNEKEYVIESGMYYDRLRCGAEVCTNLLPPEKFRGSGTSIELFARNLLDEYQIEYRTNVRDIISPKELDIYIPSKRIAIECNGIYWHSRNDKSYHVNKWKDCKNNGIQLITIWEDQIRNNPDIVRSIILSKLGIYKTKIYARKCNIISISSKECTSFLDINHLQGRTPSQVRLGLEYNGELACIMTFSKKSDTTWELTRFSNKLYTLCIGGASRLLKTFINKYHPTEIISFSSNDISDGGLYRTLDFVCDDKISESYWYIDAKTMKRYHRSSFSKSKLKQMGYDENLTEEEIMHHTRYLKIWDSGHIKWIKKL